MQLNGYKWENGWVDVQLILLACGAAFNVSPHKLHKIQPLELGGDKLAGL